MQDLLFTIRRERGRQVYSLNYCHGEEEKAPSAACMQSKNKKPSFLEFKIIWKLFVFVLPLIPHCPSSFVWVSPWVWSCILMLEEGRWQMGKTTNIFIVAGSCLAGRLHWEKLTLETSRWSCCGNASPSRDLLLVLLKGVASELLFSCSCCSNVPGLTELFNMVQLWLLLTAAVGWEPKESIPSLGLMGDGGHLSPCSELVTDFDASDHVKTLNWESGV